MKNLLVYLNWTNFLANPIYVLMFSNTAFCLYDYIYIYTHLKNKEKYKEEYAINKQIHHL